MTWSKWMKVGRAAIAAAAAIGVLAIAAAPSFAGSTPSDTMYLTSNNGSSLATITPSPFSAHTVGNFGVGGTYGAAFDANGDLYTFLNWGQTLAKVDTTTGHTTAVGTLAPGHCTMIALEISSTGVLYGADWCQNLYSIDKATGQMHLVGNFGIPGGFSVMDMAFDSNGTLYATDRNQLFRVDTATGHATLASTITGVNGAIMSIAFDSGGTLYATAYTPSGDYYRVDPATGAATHVGVTNLNFPHGGDFPQGPSDTTAPTAAPTQTTAANSAGWNNTDVTVDWNWSDETGGSGIDTTACTTSSTSTGEGAITLTATCDDQAGNEGTATYTVQVDKTAPAIAYSGNAGTYGVDQTVDITCTDSDALSGIATSDCVDVTGPAWQFGLGTHSYNATATDVAGNSNTASTSFEVTVSFDSLCSLVRTFSTKTDVAQGLCDKLTAAGDAAARGQAKTKDNILGAFDKQVDAQTGKALTAQQATLLKQLAATL